MMATGTRSFVAVVAVAVLPALLLPGAAMGQEAVSILGMAWTPKPVPALVISASGPLKFTRSRPQPGVEVVDFAEAVPAKPLAAVEAPAAGLRRASLVTVDEGGRRWARLRLEADADVRIEVAELPSGVEIRFAKAMVSEASTQATELEDVLPVVDSAGVSVQLTGVGRLEGQVFTLANPPRVVVDLKGVVNKVTRRVHPVGAAGVQRVRVAQFATAPQPVVRVVVDLDQPLPYHLASTAQGAVLRIGGEPAEVAAATPPAAPVKGVEQEQRVAEGVPAAPSAPAAGGEPVVSKSEAAPRAETPTASAEPAVSEPAPVATAPAVAPASSPAKAEETPVAPPKIVEEPLPAATPQAAPAPPVPAPAAVKPSAPEKHPSTPLLTPPAPASESAKAGSSADSPWTTTKAAMAEGAVPPTTVIAGTKEVESQVKHWTGEPISLELKDADVKDVLRTFAKITALNLVVDPDVSGSVTVNLDNVPWDQCLDIILRINSLDYVIENNVLRVAKISTLTRERAAIVSYQKAAEDAKPMRTVTKTLSYAKADAVRSVLTSQGFILSDRGSVVTDPRTNQLIIRDSTDRLENILNLIDGLDQPNPQVVIEARVVETTRTFSQALGVAWGFTGSADAAHGTTTGWKFPNSVIGTGGVDLGVPSHGTLAMTFADILDSFNLNFTLAAAEDAGLVKIVSSPKVTAQNNEKAHIQSGVQIPIQTVANNTVTVQYIDATLSLDVTPQITAEGTVLLDIDLKKREPYAGVNLTGGQNVPISTRDAKTRVMVRDGGTTVIGGIYQVTENDSRSGIPGLNRLPIFGALFRNKSVSNKHDELLIFITPRIIKY